MSITVLDSTDLTGILADAGVTLEEPAPPISPSKDAAAVPAPAEHDDPDDLEGDDGLTPREKRELTDKMQRAIGKKHRAVKEAEEFAAAQYSERKLAEQRAEAAQREIAELKAKLAPPKQAQQEAAQPERQNFASEAAYVDAMIQFHVDKRLAEKAEEDRQASEKRQYDERIETAKTRILRAVELVPDFEDVVMANDSQLSPEIGTYLEESEMVAELTYYFAKNPDVLVSLEKLSPHSRLVKIGKIESMLTPFEPVKEAQHGDKPSNATPNGKGSKPAPSEDTETGIDLSKPRSKSAPVFAPLDGTGSAGIQKDSKDMNIRESINEFAKRNQTNLTSRKRH
jgi:hypothetical protein